MVFVYEELLESAFDGDVVAMRRQLIDAIIYDLDHAKKLLYVSGAVFGPDRVAGRSPFQHGDDGVVALSYVAGVVSSLLSGARCLLDMDNTYGAAALIRQLVEAEYLAWALSEDHDEAATWIRSGKDERLRRWQPRHMRDRAGGRFRGSDYAMHCDLGGHPTPDGIRALILAADLQRQLASQLLRAELLRHATSARKYLSVAGPILAGELWLHGLLATDVDELVAEWRQRDDLPTRNWVADVQQSLRTRSDGYS